ncbi:CopY/TcrY family copper transport repressor [Enterococcus mediterraneensis]|uniref:CopY/TcrY family copper transport repressor n=1 Tax=Enterococcus mediterraneensis TaxID=2364791 RepID=UPI000F0637D6|nr:CopY/TcrY family copper transport repressor [Enterococcus mediterraneensis]
MQTIHEPIKISDSEWEIMRVLWTLGKASAQEIDELLSETMNWKLATVKTLLGRLVKKEVVRTETEGKKFIYFPIVGEAETVRSATETLFSHICAKRVGTTIADLIAEADLTQEDIEKIQKVLSQKEPVATIVCNCIPGQCNCKR